MKRLLYAVLIFTLCLTFTSCKRPDVSKASSASESLTASSFEESGANSDAESAFTVVSGTNKSTQAVNTSKQSSVSASSKAPDIKITIPEGYNAFQIGALLEQKGVCSKKDFLSTINSYDFTYYPLVKKINATQHRFLKLEGYLFPDTYVFHPSDRPQDVIGKFLRNTENKMSAYSSGSKSVDDILKLASILEKEVGNKDERKKVSSVFYNRLNTGMKLQSEATVVYLEKYVLPNKAANVSREFYTEYYNTNKCKALPEGPICNPGKAAIEAALDPEKTNYYYFVTKDAKYYYAETYEQHKQNLINLGLVSASASSSSVSSDTTSN